MTYRIEVSDKEDFMADALKWAAVLERDVVRVRTGQTITKTPGLLHGTCRFCRIKTRGVTVDTTECPWCGFDGEQGGE